MKKKLIAFVTALVLVVTSIVPAVAAGGDGSGSSEVFDGVPGAEPDGLNIDAAEEDWYDLNTYREFTTTIWCSEYYGQITRETAIVGPGVVAYEYYNGTEWVDASQFKKTYKLEGNEEGIPFRFKFSEPGMYVWRFVIEYQNKEGNTAYVVKMRFLNVEEDGAFTALPNIPAPKNLKAEGRVNGKHRITWDPIGDNAFVTYTVSVGDKVIGTTNTNSYDIEDSAFPTDGNYTINVMATREGASHKKTSSITYNVKKVNTYNVTVDGKQFATVDEGATVTLPKDAKVGYYADGKLYKAGSTYTVAKNVDFASVNIAMASGASIKLATPTGIRFRATIESGNSAVFDNAVKSEGILIAPSDTYKEDPDVLLTTSDSAINVVNSGWYNNVTGSYCATITNIKSYNYTRGYVARAYVTVEYADGATETIYSNVSGAKSIQGVAAAIKLAADYNALTAEQQALVDMFAAAK